jgi:predicted dehydrogenase
MRFLIAGLGSIGRRHLRNLLTLGQKDILLYRSKLSTLPDEELDGFPMEVDLQRALAAKPDAVIISNPTALHLDVAIPAARTGCSLFLEKPISNNMERIPELEKAVISGGGKVFMGFQFRFHPDFQKIRNLLEKNEIGRVIYVRCQWSEYLPGWHPWEDYRKGYSARSDLGGGVVLSLCHPIDYLHWLLGEIDQVNAFIGKLSDLEVEVEDTAEIMLRFVSGALGSLHLDFIQQPAQHFLEITGAEGMIQWNNKDGVVHLFHNSTRQWEVFNPEIGLERNEMFLNEMRHFIKVIEGNTQPLCSLQDGIFVQRIAENIYKSSKKGSWIKYIF